MFCEFLSFVIQTSNLHMFCFLLFPRLGAGSCVFLFSGSCALLIVLLINKHLAAIGSWAGGLGHFQKAGYIS